MVTIDIVNRLREEKQGFNKGERTSVGIDREHLDRTEKEKEDDKKLGQEHGYDDAEAMPYVAFLEVEQIVKNGLSITDSWLWVHGALQDSVNELIRERYEGWRRHAPAIHRPYLEWDSYLRGWVEGVLLFWNEVKDKL